jgi:hypothetical protein
MLSSKIRRFSKTLKYSKDMIPGGLGDKDPDSAFDPKELAEGIKHEMEHTKVPSIAKEIAKDHIKPITPTPEEKSNSNDDRVPDYYELLNKMESLASSRSIAVKKSNAHQLAVLQAILPTLK